MIDTGFFDRIRNRYKAANGYYYAITEDGSYPIHSDIGENIYASEIVAAAIRAKANEMMKLSPRHIVSRNGIERTESKSSVARVLERPTPYMTTADFFGKAMILLELTKNAYLYPTWYTTNEGKREYTGIYPLKPESVTYLQDDEGKYFVQLDFSSGYTVTVPKDDIIHWRKDYVDEYYGGSDTFCESRQMLRRIREYDEINQSLAKAAKVSLKVNGIYRINTYKDNEKLENIQREFNERLMSTDSGWIATDLKGEMIPASRDPKLIDSETLKHYYKSILTPTGVSLPILQGTATMEEKRAFYEHALEPFILSLSQAMTMCFFSRNERSFGNKIVLYPGMIEFMSPEQKFKYMQIAVPAGAMKVNEIRGFVGLPPLEEGGDERPRAYNSLDGLINEKEGEKIDK